MDKKDMAQDKAMIKKGGPTSMDRKTYGKNLSRAMNQKSGSK
jgi:hypothetical protein